MDWINGLFLTNFGEKNTINLFSDKSNIFLKNEKNGVQTGEYLNKGWTTLCGKYLNKRFKDFVLFVWNCGSYMDFILWF